MADYITYPDLEAAIAESGRNYDLDLIRRAYTLANEIGRASCRERVFCTV